MTLPAPRLANAPAAHFDLEPFHVMAHRELADFPLAAPGVCLNPMCSRVFAPSRSWQRYCCEACRKMDEAEMRRIGAKSAPALLAWRMGKYEKETQRCGLCPARVAITSPGFSRSGIATARRGRPKGGSMSDHSLDRFREYSTSGAFNLALSRAQVSALAMIAESGDAAMGAHTCRALHHKGLVTDIRGPSGGVEYPLTPAGVYALKLVRLADLVQGDAEPVEAEISALTDGLDKARRIASDAVLVARSMQARAEQAHRAVKAVRRFLKSGAPRPKPIITLKDPHPETTFQSMVAALDIAEETIDGGR